MSRYYTRAEFRRDYELMTKYPDAWSCEPGDVEEYFEDIFRGHYPDDEERVWKLIRFSRMTAILSDCWTDFEIVGLLGPKMTLSEPLLVALVSIYCRPIAQVPARDLHQLVTMAAKGYIKKPYPEDAGAIPPDFYNNDNVFTFEIAGLLALESKECSQIRLYRD